MAGEIKEDFMEVAAFLCHSQLKMGGEREGDSTTGVCRHLCACSL